MTILYNANMNKNGGQLVVISGPSAGVGKDTLLKMFLEAHPDWIQPPSTTTRPPRTGEVAGKDYIFVSTEEFKTMQRQGRFLETDHHADHWYGTQSEPVKQALDNGRNVILRIDVNGGMAVKQKMPEAILIFITAESDSQLEDQIRARATNSDAYNQKRLQMAKKEMAFKDRYDHVVVNRPNKQAEALKDIETAIGL